MIDRDLTVAQYLRLARIGDDEPEACVVAWHERGGPVIRTEHGDFHRITTLGRRNALPNFKQPA